MLVDMLDPGQKKRLIQKKAIFEEILTSKQKQQLDILILFWLLSTVLFFVWWCWPTHIISPGHFIFNTFVISIPMLIPFYAFYFIRRMKKTNAALGVPKEWRVAMIVTKAPSEPWAVVKRTLQGMLDEDSVPHDTWLADEDPSEETKAWCAERGIRISCRKGVKKYHNLDFPRRTRCKEGNLAYFYDHWGYDMYDFVCQMDADHMPLKGYLRHALVAFHDPNIGYVTAPSICDANAKDSWTARGRLFVESTMHGTQQAGSYGNWAPMCIGSHFTVRTAALKHIGGLGPELAEDHSTTFLFCINGWKGAHAINAIASGLGPVTFKDGMTQEFQWSRSLFVLFLTLTRKNLNRCPFWMRFQFLFSELWYHFYAAGVLGAIALSPIALLTGQSFMNLQFWDFFFGSSIPVVFCILIVAYLKKNRLLRPLDAKLISWEGGLFSMARYPVVLWASVEAVWLTFFSQKRVWKVTPKKKENEKGIPLKFMLPHYLIVGICLLVQLFVRPNEHTWCYSIFNAINLISYIGVLIAIHIFNRIEAAAIARRETEGGPIYA